MNVGFWNFYPAFNQNRMFEQPVTSQGHDWSAPSRLLGKTLESEWHRVATLDMKPLEWFDKVVFVDYPDHFLRRNRYFHTLLRATKRPDLYLIVCEPAIVRPEGYIPALHEPFRKVLTYDKTLCAINPGKYVFSPLPCLHPVMADVVPLAQRKLCCLIQSYMVLDKPGELYSERIRAARWFEANAPQDFTLIGTEWDRVLLPGPLSRFNFALRAAYRRIWPLTKVRFNLFPSYAGPNTQGKHRTLRDYRFCVAYENSVQRDYISEKLFDCFYAGCVPIYLGAPNVTDYIPPETFIDKRRFTYEELHRYISMMPSAEYGRFISAGQDFLNSRAMRQFTPEHHAWTIKKAIGL